MWNNKIYRCVLLLLVLMMPVAVMARKKKAVEQQELKPLLTASEQQYFDSLYVLAVTQDLVNNPDSALSLMREAIAYYNEHIQALGRTVSLAPAGMQKAPNAVVAEEVPGLAAAFYFVSQQYRQRNDGGHALGNIQGAVAIDSVNYWYTAEEAELLMIMRQLPLARESYERLVRLHPDKSEPLYALADIYLRLDSVDACLQMLDRMEELDGLNPQITQNKFYILQEAGRVEEGFEAYRKLIKEHPYDIRYRLKLGDLQMQNAQIEQAKKTYDEAAAIDPDNAYVWVAQANYYSMTGNQAEADKLVAGALMNANLDVETKNEVMTEYLKGTYRKLSNYRLQVAQDNVTMQMDTLALFNTIDSLFVSVSAMHPTSPEFYELHAQWLNTQDKDSLAAECMRFAVDLRPTSQQYWEQLLYHSSSWMEKDKLIELCDEALALHPTMQTAYMVKAWSYLKQEENLKAIEQYQLAIENLPQPDANKISSLWGSIGDIYHQMGDTERSYECYDKAVTYNPQNYKALNNFAYYLCLEQRDLSKAESMALKVIQKYPDNPTYLDTYAWVLYLEGSYVLADFYQQKAVDCVDPNTTDNCALYDHFGDIKVKNGDLKGAVEQWKKALNCSDCDKPEEIQKKIDSAELLLK